LLRLEDLNVFVRAADSGSLSAAARDLGVAPAVASTAIKRLERTLDTPLFIRSTRSLRLTREGERYLQHVREVLRLLADGQAEISRDKAALGGTLHIAAPSDFGRNVLLEWLDEFQLAHPKLAMRLRFSDRVTDMYRQPVDLAIRYGLPEDSNLIALPLAAANRRVLCASPAYLARHGPPASIDALRQHNCLLFMLGDQVHNRWRFHRGRDTVEVAVKGDRVSDDAEVVRRWALSGQGIAYKSWLDMARDVQAGRLVVLLPDWQGEAAPLNLLCPHRTLLSAAVTRLRDDLQARCNVLVAQMVHAVKS
jgi:DNA-binding transcriptional LysR family regulator